MYIPGFKKEIEGIRLARQCTDREKRNNLLLFSMMMLAMKLSAVVFIVWLICGLV